MSDILSQSEIDNLLAALSKGEVKAEEIKKEEDDKKVKVYDFMRPNKFSKEQLHTLHIIHENFARFLTTFLSAQLRSLVQVNVLCVEQLTYTEFITSIPNPSIISVINVSSLNGAIILEVNPAVAFNIVDRLLGGSGEFKEKLREPTEIESSIIEKVIKKMIKLLEDAWQDITEIKFDLEKLETNPQFIQLVSLNEAIALVTLNTKIGNNEGMINLCIPHCIPHIVIEPIVSKLSTRVWLSNSKSNSVENKELLMKKIASSTVDIRAEVGNVNITIKDFLNLNLGDVITLDTNIKDDIYVYVQDRLKFKGVIGISNNKMAVKITEIVTEEESYG